MRRLHDRTRRLVCRTAFFAVCLLPTVCIVAWSARQHLPGYRHAHEAALGQRFGLRASIDKVSHPRPAATVYQHVVLADPETGRRLVDLPEVKMVRARGGWIWVAAEALVESAELALLYRSLQGGLRTWDAFEGRLVVGEVRFLDSLATVRLSDLAVDLRANRGEAGWDARFQVGDRGLSAGPFEVHVVRNRRPAAGRPTTSITLNAAAAPLPCSLLTGVLPAARALGPRCLYQGRAEVSGAAAEWTGRLQGDLIDIDLETLVAGRYPHRLSGRARATGLAARFRDGRITSLSGRIEAGPGTIDRSLVSAAIDALYLPLRGAAWEEGGAFHYEQLAIDFSLTAAGLYLQGRCPGPIGGVLLTGRSGLVVPEPQTQPVPALALVRMLVPRVDVLVPATRQTEPLVRALPLPVVDSPRVARQGPPR